MKESNAIVPHKVAAPKRRDVEDDGGDSMKRNDSERIECDTCVSSSERARGMKMTQARRGTVRSHEVGDKVGSDAGSSRYLKTT